MNPPSSPTSSLIANTCLKVAIFTQSLSVVVVYLVTRFPRSRPLKVLAESSGDVLCESFLARLDPPGEQFCKGGPFQSMLPSKHIPRIALLIRGESFRRNVGMYDRDITVTEESLKCQLRAAASHVKHLIEPAESCGVKVDVFIVTWEPEGSIAPKAMKMMAESYRPRVVIAEWNNHTHSLAPGVNGQSANYMAAIGALARYCRESKLSYTGALVLRADLVIKRPIFNLRSANWSRVLFAFHEWEMGGGFPSETVEQRVPDVLFWFPWKSLNCVNEFGWNEHGSSGIHTKMGLKFTGLMMPDEFHDSNSAVDWNPIYTQACRPAQKFDVHGGPAYALFNVKEVTTEKDMGIAGESFRIALFNQGTPQAVIPPMGIVAHSWSTQEAVKKLINWVFGTILHDAKHESLNRSLDDSGWLTALHSMARSFALLKRNKELVYRLQFDPRYTYDRVSFVRLEHNFPRQQVRLYDLPVSNEVYVLFGAKTYPSVPTLITMSHEAAWKLGEHLEAEDAYWNLSNVLETSIGAEAWLRNVTGKAVKRMHLSMFDDVAQSKHKESRFLFR